MAKTLWMLAACAALATQAGTIDVLLLGAMIDFSADVCAIVYAISF